MIDQVLFNENELKQLSDKTLYFLYKGYYNQAFVDYIDENNKAYYKHRDIAYRLKKEILSRCDKVDKKINKKIRSDMHVK